MKQFEELKDLVSSAEQDAVKFAGGNKAAGTRLRAHMQAIKTKAQDIRAEVTEIKNGRAE